MSAHVYSGFGSLKNKQKYICKSEITRSALDKMGIPASITVEQVKTDFDQLEGVYISRGSPYDPNKRRATKYVLKFALYSYVIKGRKLKVKY